MAWPLESVLLPEMTAVARAVAMVEVMVVVMVVMDEQNSQTASFQPRMFRRLAKFGARRCSVLMPNFDQRLIVGVSVKIRRLRYFEVEQDEKLSTRVGRANPLSGSLHEVCAHGGMMYVLTAG